jgi:hypothetical protein
MAPIGDWMAWAPAVPAVQIATPAQNAPSIVSARAFRSSGEACHLLQGSAQQRQPVPGVHVGEHVLADVDVLAGCLPWKDSSLAT